MMNGRPATRGGRVLIDVGLYNNVAEVVRDAIRHMMKEYDKVDTAAELYRQEKISLAKAAEIAGVSFIKMKGILVERGMNPYLGAEGPDELRRDYLTLKGK